MLLAFPAVRPRRRGLLLGTCAPAHRTPPLSRRPCARRSRPSPRRSRPTSTTPPSPATPLCSILTATGDRRPGRLLLADSGADRFRSIAAMAATPAGRADLDCLAAATEAFASALDADGEGS